MKKERKEIAITLLKTPERNTRIHPEKQIREIRRSLKKWGQYRDAVIDERNLILAGNGLIQAMRAEGFKTAWVVAVYDLSEHDKIKFMLADNKTAGLGIDDLDNIERLIGGLNGDFDIPGFDDDILKSIDAASEAISKALDGYGIATPENLMAIESRSRIPVPPEPDKTGTGGTGEPDARAEGEDAADRNRVICPQCGAVIWL